MQLIFATIQPTRLQPVVAALEDIGVDRLTVCDATGYGRQGGRTPMFRGHEYKTKLLRKVVLEIAVNDDFLERVIEVIESVARTTPDGEIGDGKIFVLPLHETIQISDRMRGPQAI